jgi:hypothetical protein
MHTILEINNVITSEPVEALKEKVTETVEKILPPIKNKIEDDKNEIWDGLSQLYYKYETNDWKKTFREVINEISEKINEDKWDTIYNKLYGEIKRES